MAGLGSSCLCRPRSDFATPVAADVGVVAATALVDEANASGGRAFAGPACLAGEVKIAQWGAGAKHGGELDNLARDDFRGWQPGN